MSEEEIDKLWGELKKKCCSNPETAVRIVCLEESTFKSVVRKTFPVNTSGQEQP